MLRKSAFATINDLPAEILHEVLGEVLGQYFHKLLTAEEGGELWDGLASASLVNRRWRDIVVLLLSEVLDCPSDDLPIKHARENIHAVSGYLRTIRSLPVDELVYEELDDCFKKQKFLDVYSATMYAQTIMQHFTEYPAVNPRDIDPGMLLTTHSEVVMTVRSACSSMRFLRRGVMTRHVENMLEKNCRIASFAMVFLQAIIHLLVTIQEHKLVIQDLKVEMQIDQQELEAMFENQKIPLPGELLKVYQKFDWLLNGLETGLLDEGRAPSGCLNFICRTHPRTLPPTDEEFMQAIKISRMGPPALRFAVEKTANSMHGDLRRRLRRLVAKMDCGEPVNDSDSVLSASASSES